MKLHDRAWLVHLERTPGAYASLLDEHGGALDLAAWELASTKAGGVPSAAEVMAAWHEIATRTSYTGPPVTARALASMCRAAGLAVL